MKRIVQLALAIALALALMLPVAAIANIDGSEPEWDGYAGIRPASDVLTIGDPTDEPTDGYFDLDEAWAGYDRHPLARDGDVDTIDVPELEGSGIVAISGELAETGCNIPVALFYATLAVAVLALALAIVALVKKK